MRDIAAAEPHAQPLGRRQHGGVANDLRVPRQIALKDVLQLLPVNAVLGSRQTQTADLIARATSVQHPPVSIRVPDGGLADAVLVEGAKPAWFENRIRPQLGPDNAVV